MPRLSPRPSRVDRLSVSITEKKKCPINRTYTNKLPDREWMEHSSLHFTGNTDIGDRSCRRSNVVNTARSRAVVLRNNTMLALTERGEILTWSPHIRNYKQVLWISVVCPSAKRAGRSSRSSVRTQFSVVRTSEYGVDSLVQMCLVPWFGGGRRGGGGSHSKHHKNKLCNCNLFYIDYRSIIRRTLHQFILFWSSLIRQLVP